MTRLLFCFIGSSPPELYEFIGNGHRRQTGGSSLRKISVRNHEVKCFMILDCERYP